MTTFSTTLFSDVEWSGNECTNVGGLVSTSHARAYFVGKSDTRPYAGAAFETLGHSWCDPEFADTITPSDLLALGCLSTPVKGYTAIELLDAEFLAKAAQHLSAVPADASIDGSDAAAYLAEDGPLARLYRDLRTIKGMGKTRTSKLLARKRPGLVPIRDRNVERAVGGTNALSWWSPFRELVTQGDAPLISVARNIHSYLDLPQVVTPLRVLDAVLWRSEER